MTATKSSSSIFVNCPFDDAYRPLFNAIVFAIFDCGYLPRSALEFEDSSQVRIEKIVDIIRECKYGIHDISRTELDPQTKLPRFNMAFELGLFIGAKKFGGKRDKGKVSLILDREKYRYQAFISDISGQDIKNHDNEPDNVIPLVRNWLQNSSRRVTIPGGKAILRRFHQFLAELPEMCAKLRLDSDDLIFNDYASLVAAWLDENSA